MLMSNIVIVYTDGEMKANDIKRECCSGKWIPIFCYRLALKNTIPLFSDLRIDLNFIKRNLPRHWDRGGTIITDKDIEFIENKGCEIRRMDYPNKLKDLPDVKFDFEILEFDERPDFKIQYQ